MDCLNSNNKEFRFTVGSKKLEGTVLSARLVPGFGRVILYLRIYFSRYDGAHL